MPTTSLHLSSSNLVGDLAVDLVSIGCQQHPLRISLHANLPRLLLIEVTSLVGDFFICLATLMVASLLFNEVDGWLLDY